MNNIKLIKGMRIKFKKPYHPEYLPHEECECKVVDIVPYARFPYRIEFNSGIKTWVNRNFFIEQGISLSGLVNIRKLIKYING